MPIEHALLLKGFVLAHNPPAEIAEAVEAVIAACRNGDVTVVTGDFERIIPAPLRPMPEDAENESLLTPKPEKKKRNWSLEARAAAAERMKAMRAAKVAVSTPGKLQAPSIGGA